MRSFFESLQAELDNFPCVILKQISSTDANHKIDILFKGNFNPISSLFMILFNHGMKISTWNMDTSVYISNRLHCDSSIIIYDITIECEYDFNRLMIDNQEI